MPPSLKIWVDVRPNESFCDLLVSRGVVDKFDIRVTFVIGDYVSQSQARLTSNWPKDRERKDTTLRYAVCRETSHIKKRLINYVIDVNYKVFIFISWDELVIFELKTFRSEGCF